MNADSHDLGSNVEIPAAKTAAIKYSTIPNIALTILLMKLKLSVLKAIYFSSNIQAVRNPMDRPALLANEEIERIGSYKIFPAASKSIGYFFKRTNINASIITATDIQ